MRYAGRIKIICEKLENIWQELPDWRLSQLMNNVLASKDCFYMEDDEFIDYIKNYIKNIKGE